MEKNSKLDSDELDKWKNKVEKLNYEKSNLDNEINTMKNIKNELENFDNDIIMKIYYYYYLFVSIVLWRPRG